MESLKIVVVSAVAILFGAVMPVFAQGTAFSYQGQLASGGAPANGSYDLAFTLFATNNDGVAIAGPVTNSAAGVTNGLFTATIDFGPGVFTGGNYWLQIAVRTNGGGSFTNLSPRQPILPVPYAIMANTASNLLGTLPAAQLSGSLPASQVSGTIPLEQLPGDVLTNNASGVFLNGSFNGFHGGDGGGLTNLNPLSVASGNVAAQLNATNQFNLFSGSFNGFHGGNGGGLTNLNPLSIASGNVAAQLNATNQFNLFNGSFNGFHGGDGGGLTNLNPLSIASGNVAAQLNATNQSNVFNGSFNGSHAGNGAGLTNLNPVVFGTLTPDATGTNFIIPCAINNIRYDNVTLATNINVAGVTNWPGAGSLKILTAPVKNVVFTCPANWFPLNTNGLVVTGAYWTETISSNHMGWLSWEKDNGNDQTNVTFTFTVSP